MQIHSWAVSSWDELCSKVEKAKQELDVRDGENLWFRGVDKSSHGLLPSLFRRFEEKTLNTRKIQKQIKELENDLFFEFLSKARFTEGANLSGWDVLFLMQHYRTPTRLLDWTEVLNVAVYFATAYRQKQQDEPSRVYLMNPYLWNEEHGYDRDLYWPRFFSYDEDDDYYYDYDEILVGDYVDWKYPCALYPAQRDPRLSAQRGYFTIHGWQNDPLEKMSPKLLRCIDIHGAGIGQCKKQMEYSGIDEFALFPDLEGLSRRLKKENGY